MTALLRQFQIAKLAPLRRQYRKRESVASFVARGVARRRLRAFRSEQRLCGEAQASSSRLRGVGLKVQEGPTSDEPIGRGRPAYGRQLPTMSLTRR